MSVTIPYPHRPAGHCASGAFRDLLEYRGYRHRGRPLSEPMVFGLGAGLDVMYIPRPSPRTPFYLGGRAPGLEESLVARLGGSLERRAEPDPDQAWAHVRERLDRGDPVAMVADCQKLEYLKTRTSMPLHVIVATGYDDSYVLIADNDREAIQRCSHASLREARGAQGFPLPAMNVTFEIDWPARLPAVESLVRPAIAEAAQWMRAPGGYAVALFGEQAFGLAAIEALERDACGWVDSPPAEGGARAGTLLWIAIEKAGTGGAFFRGLYRDFLTEAYELAPSPALAAARAHYASLADEWAALGAVAATTPFAQSAERLVALARAEREGVALLERAGAEGA